MATIVGDVLGLQQRHHPKNIPHLVKKVKGFPLKVKETLLLYLSTQFNDASFDSW